MGQMPHQSMVLKNALVRARQLDSVAQLVRALHRNRRAAGSIIIILSLVYFASCNYRIKL